MIIRNYCQLLSVFVVMGLSLNLLDIHHEVFTVKCCNTWGLFQNNEGGSKWKKDRPWTDG